jgi:ATP-binding cassette subfamily C protein
VTFAIQVGSQSAFGTFPNAVGSIVAEGFLFNLILGSFILVDFKAALLAIVYFGVIAFLIQFFLGRLMQNAANKAATSTVEANSLITDLSETIRESSILGRRQYFYNFIFQKRKQAAEANATQVVLSGMPRHIVESALIAGIAAFILTQLSGGDLTTSAAIIGIFLSGGLRLTASLLPLQSAFLQIKVATPAAIRALDIIEEFSSEEHPGAKHQPRPQVRPSGPLGVSLRDVSFGYASLSPKVLRNISLDIEPGFQAALIGVSGSGKSTLADIILGLLDKDSGKILIGGMEPAHIATYFPGLVGYVPQRPGLVSGTILQNIALGVGDEGLDEDQLAYALESSNLEEFVATLPDGLLTDIGKRKDELSGGQLQRIGLARALYTNPKLLILDEATSALDAESENEINIALDKMRGDVTVIMIAHRLNTVKNSDMVFLMEDGLISSSGKFQDLVKANKKVRNLANLMSIESDTKLNKNV